MTSEPGEKPSYKSEAAVTEAAAVAADSTSTTISGTGPSLDNAEDWIEGIALWTVLAGVAIEVFILLLDLSIVSTAIPQITNDFHSLEDVGCAALQPLSGKIYTYFKTKWTYLICFAIFEVGSLICGLATSSTMLIIGRAVAGMASSGMMNGGLNIIAGAVPMQRRPVVLGIIMAIGQLGLLSGPMIGGALTTYVSWRWCFYINLPIGGIVAISLMFIRIPEQKPKGPTRETLRTLSPIRDLDLIGFVLFAAASLMLLLALDYGGNKFAWNSATVIGLLCGSAATFGVLVLWETHMGVEAMIPGHLVRQRIVWCSCLMVATVYGMIMILSYYLPMYFQAVRGTSALIGGVDLLPNILCQMAMSVASGLLMTKLGYYLPWAVFGSILNVVGCGLLSTMGPFTSIPDWAGYQALVGFGRGATMQVPTVAIQNAVAKKDMSIAMAILTFSQTLGGAVFLSVAEAIFAHALRVNLPLYAPSVDVQAVIDAGATGFRDIVSADQLPSVLQAYSKSLNWVFYLSVGLGGVQFVSSLGTGWRNVRKKVEEKKGIA